MLNLKNLLAIIAVVAIFSPFTARAAYMVYPFGLDVSVNSGSQDGLFVFHVLPNSMEYDPEYPFLDFSVQTSSGNGLYSLFYGSSYLFEGNSVYNLIEDLPTGWKLGSASCQAIKTATIPANNCEDIIDEETECVPQYIDTETVVDDAVFAPIQNGISMRIPIQSGKISAKCVFTNTKENGKTPVLFVPGLLGTEIKKDNEILWFNNAVINPLNSDDFLDSLALKDDFSPIQETSLTNVITRKSGFGWEYDYTEGIANEFKSQGYVIDEGTAAQNFFTFPYDWRYGVIGKNSDNKTNSELLKEKIDQLAASSPTGRVDVIAHSMGGLIVKKYVMDNADPKIGKLVFVGVPNLGSIDAAKTLLMGNNFKVTGLNDKEIYKISQNMPAAYDLLPSQAYFSSKGSYVNDLNHFPFGSKLDYDQVNSLFKQTGLNRQGLDNAVGIHTPEFDGYDVRSKNIDAYNIVGCKSPTIAGVNYLITDEGSEGYSIWRDPISGDDTVPRESAESIPADSEKTFYAVASEHGKMPSAAGIRQKIVNIIAGKNLDEGRAIYTKSQVDQNSSLCKLRVMVLIALSPVNIKVTDKNGSKLGTDDDGSVRYEIPGAGFEIIDGHKYVYLPIDNNQTYDIDLKGTGTGTFTLIKKEIGNDQAVPAIVFNDIPVTLGFNARLDVSGTAPKIITGGGQEILPTVEVSPESSGDTVPPQTTIAINGNPAKNFYNNDISINLSAQDFSQEEIIPAGVFSTNYSLDGMAFAEYENLITVSAEGTHHLSYFTTDKLGNKEKEKTISFIIDKTPPEIKFGFDQIKKDFVFTAADNISNPENIVILDQNGAVSATDEAGNVAKMSFAEKNRKQSLRAQLLEFSYNGKSVDIKGNQLAFAWFYGYTPKIPLALTGLQSLPAVPATLPKTGSLSFLLQQAKLKDGSFVVALYANSKTLILEYKSKKLNLKTVSGLKIINFNTNKGVFSWSY
jgi:hypothetical protein